MVWKLHTNKFIYQDNKKTNIQIYFYLISVDESIGEVGGRDGKDCGNRDKTIRLGTFWTISHSGKIILYLARSLVPFLN